jgi:cell division protein FtsB
MNALLLPLSILCGLILCATAISLFVVHRAHCLLREIEGRAGARQSQSDAGLQTLRDTVDALAAQIHDLQNHPSVAPPPGLPKPGINLNKRSRALGMHRRGEGAEQIAAALELPRQEVDLLLKVHRIVLSNV